MTEIQQGTQAEQTVLNQQVSKAKKFFQLRKKLGLLFQNNLPKVNKLNDAIVADDSSLLLKEIESQDPDFIYNYFMMSQDELLRTPIVLIFDQKNWYDLLKIVNGWSSKNFDTIQKNLDLKEVQESPQMQIYFKKLKYDLIKSICKRDNLDQNKLVEVLSEENSLMTEVMKWRLDFKNLVGMIPDKKCSELFEKVFSQIAYNLGLQSAQELQRYGVQKRKEKIWKELSFVNYLSQPSVLVLQEIQYTFMHELARKKQQNKIYQIIDKIQSIAQQFQEEEQSEEEQEEQEDNQKQHSTQITQMQTEEQKINQIKQSFLCSFSSAGETPIDIILSQWSYSSIKKFLQRVKDLKFVHLSTNSLNKVLMNKKLNQKQIHELIEQIINSPMPEKGYCEGIKAQIYRRGFVQQIGSMGYNIIMGKRCVLAAKDKRNSYPLANCLDKYLNNCSLTVIKKLLFQNISEKIVKDKIVNLTKNIGIEAKSLDNANLLLKQVEELAYYQQPLLKLICKTKNNQIVEYFLNNVHLNYFTMTFYKMPENNTNLHLFSRHFITFYVELQKDLSKTHINQQIINKIFDKNQQNNINGFNFYIQMLRQFHQYSFLNNDKGWLIQQIKIKLKAYINNYISTNNNDTLEQTSSRINKGNYQNQVKLFDMLSTLFTVEQRYSMKSLDNRSIFQDEIRERKNNKYEVTQDQIYCYRLADRSITVLAHMKQNCQKRKIFIQNYLTRSQEQQQQQQNFNIGPDAVSKIYHNYKTFLKINSQKDSLYKSSPAFYLYAFDFTKHYRHGYSRSGKQQLKVGLNYLNNLPVQQFELCLKINPHLSFNQYRQLILRLNSEQKCFILLDNLIQQNNRVIDNKFQDWYKNYQQQQKDKLSFTGAIKNISKTKHAKLNIALSALISDSKDQNKYLQKNKIYNYNNEHLDIFIKYLSKMIQIKNNDIGDDYKSNILFAVFKVLYYRQRWSHCCKIIQIVSSIKSVNKQIININTNDEQDQEKFKQINIAKSFLIRSFQLVGKELIKFSQKIGKYQLQQIKDKQKKKTINQLLDLLQKQGNQENIYLFKHSWIVDPERACKITKIKCLPFAILRQCLQVHPQKINMLNKVQTQFFEEYQEANDEKDNRKNIQAMKKSSNNLLISQYKLNQFKQKPYLVDFMILEQKIINTLTPNVLSNQSEAIKMAETQYNKQIEQQNQEGKKNAQQERKFQKNQLSNMKNYLIAFKKKKMNAFLTKQVIERYQQIYTQEEVKNYCSKIFRTNELKSIKQLPTKYLEIYLKNNKKIKGIYHHNSNVIKQLIDLKYINKQDFFDIVKTCRLDVIDYFVQKMSCEIDYSFISSIKSSRQQGKQPQKINFIEELLKIENQEFIIQFLKKYKIFDMYKNQRYEQTVKTLLWSIAVLRRTKILKYLLQHFQQKFKNSPLKFDIVPVLNEAPQIQTDSKSSEINSLVVTEIDEDFGLRDNTVYLPMKIAAANRFYEYHFLLKQHGIHSNIKIQSSNRFLLGCSPEEYAFIPIMKKKLQLLLLLQNYFENNKKNNANFYTHILEPGIINQEILPHQEIRVKRYLIQSPYISKQKYIQMFLRYLNQDHIKIEQQTNNAFLAVLYLKSLKDIIISEDNLLKFYPQETKLVNLILSKYPINVQSSQENLNKVLKKQARLKEIVYESNPKYMLDQEVIEDCNEAQQFFRSHSFALNLRFFERLPKEKEHVLTQYINKLYSLVQAEGRKLSFLRSEDLSISLQRVTAKLKNIQMIICCIVSLYGGTQKFSKILSQKFKMSQNQLILNGIMNNFIDESQKKITKINYLPSVWAEMMQKLAKMNKIQKFTHTGMFKPFFQQKYNHLLNYNSFQQVIQKCSQELPDVFAAYSFFKNIIYLIYEQRNLIQHYIDFMGSRKAKISFELGKQIQVNFIENQAKLIIPVQIEEYKEQQMKMKKISLDSQKIKNHIHKQVIFYQLQTWQSMFQQQLLNNSEKALAFEFDFNSFRSVLSCLQLSQMVKVTKKQYQKIKYYTYKYYQDGLNDNEQTCAKKQHFKLDRNCYLFYRSEIVDQKYKNEMLIQQKKGSETSQNQIEYYYIPNGIINIQQQILRYKNIKMRTSDLDEHINKNNLTKEQIISHIEFTQFEPPLKNATIKYSTSSMLDQEGYMNIVSDLKQYLRYITNIINKQDESKIGYNFNTSIYFTPMKKVEGGNKIIYHYYYYYNISKFLNKISQYDNQICLAGGNLFRYDIFSLVQILERNVGKLKTEEELYNYLDQLLGNQRNVQFVGQMLLNIHSQLSQEGMDVKILLQYKFQSQKNLKNSKKSYMINQKISYYETNFRLEGQVLKIVVYVGPTEKNSKKIKIQNCDFITQEHYLNQRFPTTEQLAQHILETRYQGMTEQVTRIFQNKKERYGLQVNILIQWKKLFAYLEKKQKEISLKSFLRNFNNYVVDWVSNYIDQYLDSKQPALRNQILLESYINNVFLKQNHEKNNQLTNEGNSKHKLIKIGTFSRFNNIKQIKNSFLIQIHKKHYFSMDKIDKQIILGYKQISQPALIQFTNQTIDNVQLESIDYFLIASKKIPTNDEINNEKIINIFIAGLDQNIYLMDKNKMLNLSQQNQLRLLTKHVPSFPPNITITFKDHSQNKQISKIDDINSLNIQVDVDQYEQFRALQNTRKNKDKITQNINMLLKKRRIERQVGSKQSKSDEAESSVLSQFGQIFKANQLN